MSESRAKKTSSMLAAWLRTNARRVRVALSRSPSLEDRDLARELDRLMTQRIGEEWDA